MSTILYARSVLSPKSMLVWLMMMELPRSGVALPEDDSLLARLCMTTPRGLATARAEIAAAGLDGEVVQSPSIAGNKLSSTERVRRYRERKALQDSVSGVTDGTVKALHDGVSSVSSGVTSSVSSVTPCVSSDVSGVPSCAQADDARICAGAEIDNQNKIILGLYTESESDNTYTVETPREILGDFLQKPPCESPSVAEPEILEPEIILPDPSAIRSAVSGMLGGVLGPMSDTHAELATTPPANAETTGQSAILPPTIRQSRIVQPMESVDAADRRGPPTPVSPCRAGTGPVATSRSRKDYDDGFTEFWAHYPRQKGHDKASAAAKYATTLKITTHDEIMRQLRGYLAHLADNAWKQPQHPATWLNKTFVRNAEEPLDWTAPDPIPRGGDAGPSVMRPGKRASFDPVEAAFQAEMAEIGERERENHVH